jgi:hypothetical protein
LHRHTPNTPLRYQLHLVEKDWATGLIVEKLETENHNKNVSIDSIIF